MLKDCRVQRISVTCTKQNLKNQLTVTIIIILKRKSKYLVLSLTKLEESSPVSVNAVWSRWKKSSPWLRERSFCCSDGALTVSLSTLADFKMAVKVIISVLFRHPCPLQSPSIMDTNCFCVFDIIYILVCEVASHYFYYMNCTRSFPLSSTCRIHIPKNYHTVWNLDFKQHQVQL